MNYNQFVTVHSGFYKGTSGVVKYRFLLGLLYVVLIGRWADDQRYILLPFWQL